MDLRRASRAVEVVGDLKIVDGEKRRRKGALMGESGRENGGGGQHKRKCPRQRQTSAPRNSRNAPRGSRKAPESGREGSDQRFSLFTGPRPARIEQFCQEQDIGGEEKLLDTHRHMPCASRALCLCCRRPRLSPAVCAIDSGGCRRCAESWTGLGHAMPCIDVAWLSSTRVVCILPWLLLWKYKCKNHDLLSKHGVAE